MVSVARWLVAVLMVTTASLPAGGLQDARRTVFLEGRVVDAQSGELLRGAVVLADGVQGARTSVAAAFLTGPDGRFVFRDLPAGKIGLRATKTGFITAEMKAVDLSPGARRDDLRLLLKPDATISGRVVDQFGEPVVAASVKAVQFAAVPPNEPSNLLVGETARTDDAGRYLIGKLSKDLYLVFVEGSASRATRAHDPVFFPDSLTADRATVIDLEAGTERAGVDMMVTVMPARPSSRPINKLLFNESNPASVSGTVRDGDGRAVSHITVGLRSPGPLGAIRAVIADEMGRFEIDRLPPGRFDLIATRDPSILDGMVVTTVPATATIELAAGQRLTDVALRLTRGATVSGRLRDQFGDPTEGTVWLHPKAGPGASYLAETNARGEFRFANLLPDDYVLMVDERPLGRDLRVSIDANTERTVAFLPIYYPGTANRSLATPITVGPGIELPALDVDLRPEPVTTIELTIDTAGRSIDSAHIRRVALDQYSGLPLNATLPSDGPHLSLPGTSAGRYRVLVDAREKGETNHWRGLTASTDVVSDGVTPSHVTLTLEPSSTLSVEVVFEGASVQRPPVRIMAFQADRGGFGSSRAAQVVRSNANRMTAILPGLSAGRYWIETTAVSELPESQMSWTTKSVTVGGRDLQNGWLDVSPGQEINDAIITMTDQPTEIAGSVTATSTAVSPRSVVLFAADSRMWRAGTTRVRVATVRPDGRYSFLAVNPGDYRLAPLTETRLPASADLPALLNKVLPGSVPVSIKVGERRTADLIAR